MKRVLFAWELGDGLGHIVPYRALVARLLESSIEVAFVARAPERTAAALADDRIVVSTAAADQTPPERRRPPITFADVLHNCGFHDVTTLRTRIERWRHAIRDFGPDVIVADFAPTAAIAARVDGVPAIVAGIGFYLPPALSPLPPIRYWLATDREALRVREAATLALVNQALPATGVPAAALSDAIRGDRQWLMTFPEFDHYLDRQGDDYLGAFPVPGFGAEPVWPATAPGPRVFAYLQRGEGSNRAVRYLLENGRACCLYAPTLEPELLAAARDDAAMAVFDQPLDVAAAAAGCDVAVTNANAGTVAAIALAGKPQLLVPSSLEKQVLARRSAMVGLALAAPGAVPDAVAAGCERLLAQPRPVLRAAAGFARRYRDWSLKGQTARLMDDLRTLARSR